MRRHQRFAPLLGALYGDIETVAHAHGYFNAELILHRRALRRRFLGMTKVWKDHDTDAAIALWASDSRSATAGVVQISKAHGTRPSTPGAGEHLSLPI